MTIIKKLNVFENRTYKKHNEIHIYEDRAEILLYKNKTNNIIARAIISKELAEDFSKYKWHLTKHGYVRTSLKNRRMKFLHNFILPNYNNIYVDHINNNKLDNRYNNLRYATKQQNAMNSKIPKNNKLKIKGVCFDNKRKKWRATIKINQKQIHLGYFLNINDAKDIRIKAEEKYFKEYRPNNSKE